MKLIVAVDKNWGIGKNGKLLAHIQDDMQFFKDTTMGHVVVMGRKTLDSLPGGRALEGRKNIVITANEGFSRKNVDVYTSMDSLKEALSEYDTNDIFIIGGESIYRQFLDECDEAFVTKIDYGYDADAHFPNLDENSEWENVYESEEHTSFDLAYTFNTYKRVIR